MSVYRNGERALIQIDENETFAQLRSKIANEFTDVDLVFDSGYLVFKTNSPDVTLDIGSTTDSSNIAAICGFVGTSGNEVRSARELYKVNGDSVITSEGLFSMGDVTEGTFTIGTEVFEITDRTTLNDIIAQINSSDKSSATAYWDSVTGELVIKSRTAGASMINIESGTSNFTDIMGYTITDRTNDQIVSKLTKETQELGENAIFAINGTYYTSVSNNVTSDISKLDGVTINLKNITEGQTVKLTIEKDNETVANAMSDIVDAYNELMTNVDAELAKTGELSDQTSLKMIRNQIRSLMMNSISSPSVFKNLNAIGISSNVASAGDISTGNINTLTFNKDKFLAAYASEESSIKALLVGTEEQKGIFTSIDNILQQSLEGAYGYFTSAQNSYNKQISDITEKIRKANASVEKYKERLEAKFSAMDLLIANMQNQYTSFLSGQTTIQNNVKNAGSSYFYGAM